MTLITALQKQGSWLTLTRSGFPMSSCHLSANKACFFFLLFLHVGWFMSNNVIGHIWYWPRQCRDTLLDGAQRLIDRSVATEPSLSSALLSLNSSYMRRTGFYLAARFQWHGQNVIGQLSHVAQLQMVFST